MARRGRARQAWQGKAWQARTTEEQNMIDVLLQLPPLIWVWAETIAYGTPLIIGVLAVKEACK